MFNLQTSSVDTIVQRCLNLYNKLPKTGKPIQDEWTVLSCVVQYDMENEDFDVISLGTGSKCIGASKMSPLGDILNDSHAEVVARRGFLLYLYDNINNAIDKKPSIFLEENCKYRLKSNLTFILYSSQLPCGDGSILPKSGEEEQFGEILSTKREAEDDICEIPSKQQRIEDIHRTGAKCLPHSEQDPKEAGTNYHLVGQVRTKPEGDHTLSVSCSDKIAKWIHLGLQGRLLDMCLINPIYISSIIFGGGVPYSEDSLKRAFLYRNSHNIIAKYVPKFYQSSIIFPNLKTVNCLRPASGSIVWIKCESPILEVAVQGRKLGVTKKSAKSLEKSLCISKYNIYRRFLQILYKSDLLKENILNEHSPSDVPYNKMKLKSKRYEKEWLTVKQQLFKTWTIKPDLFDFCDLNTMVNDLNVDSQKICLRMNMDKTKVMSNVHASPMLVIVENTVLETVYLGQLVVRLGSPVSIYRLIDESNSARSGNYATSF
ncbi:LOW QUALITY PROTEIN: adenosine deaminase, tRNA-specific 1 [Aphomia sociella]